MAGPYSKDLRGRVLGAIEAGEAPEAAAKRFAVARSTAYRWAAAARGEGAGVGGELFREIRVLEVADPIRHAEVAQVHDGHDLEPAQLGEGLVGE